MKPGHRLILLEGLPASGKSSSSQWLCRALQQQGIPAHWFYELAEQHPLQTDQDNRATAPEQLPAQSLASWLKLCQRMQQHHEIWILDGALLQKSLLPMFAAALEPAVIRAFMAAVWQLLAPLKPALIRLRAEDIDSHIRSSWLQRGPEFNRRLIDWSSSRPSARNRGYQGLAGSIHWWRDYHDLCDQLCAKSSVDQLHISVQPPDWPELHSRMLEFLGLPGVVAASAGRSRQADKARQRLARRIAATYAGHYRRRTPDGNADQVSHLTLRGDELIIDNLLPLLEQRSVLIPLDDKSAEVRGHDIRLHWSLGTADHPAHLIISSSWQRIDAARFEYLPE